jgi:hypothetical protein
LSPFFSISKLRVLQNKRCIVPEGEFHSKVGPHALISDALEVPWNSTTRTREGEESHEAIQYFHDCGASQGLISTYIN